MEAGGVRAGLLDGVGPPPTWTTPPRCRGSRGCRTSSARPGCSDDPGVAHDAYARLGEPLSRSGPRRPRGLGVDVVRGHERDLHERAGHGRARPADRRLLGLPVESPRRCLPRHAPIGRRAGDRGRRPGWSTRPRRGSCSRPTRQQATATAWSSRRRSASARSSSEGRSSLTRMWCPRTAHASRTSTSVRRPRRSSAGRTGTTRGLRCPRMSRPDGCSTTTGCWRWHGWRWRSSGTTEPPGRRVRPGGGAHVDRAVPADHHSGPALVLGPGGGAGTEGEVPGFVLVSGLAAAPGVASGPVRILRSPADGPQPRRGRCWWRR